MKKVNPYSILFVASLVTISLYELKWSELYPPLGNDMLIFLTILLISCYIFSIIFRHSFPKINDINRSLLYSNRYLALTIIIFILTIAEGIYSHGFPLLGTVKYGDNYGFPTIHLLITIINSYLTYTLALILFVKKIKTKRVKVCFFLNLVCLLLPFSRMIIIVTLINYLWSYFYLTTKSRKKLGFSKKIIILCCLVVGLYVFGVMGNYRTNVQENNKKDYFDSSMIYQIGMPSSRFLNSKIPSPFFWDYIYSTSALANFQNITLYPAGGNEKSATKFIMTQLMPDVFAKDIMPDEYSNLQSSLTQYQVTSTLNVSTAFFQPYYLWHWSGVYVMLIFILIFPLIYLLILRDLGDEYFMIGLSMVNTMYLLLFFDNTFKLSVVSLQLIIPLILGMVKKYK